MKLYKRLIEVLKERKNKLYERKLDRISEMSRIRNDLLFFSSARIILVESVQNDRSCFEQFEIIVE